MLCVNSTIQANFYDTRINGWVRQPNTRGTIDILWTSVFTIFICTFTMLCLNVPAPDDGWARMTGRKFLWMGLAIAGPEFVLTYASGQWGTARESVVAFQQSGFHDWTMRHGFFADMGGFWLVPREEKGFPITAKHLHWLIMKGHLEYPQISTHDIWDKSKQDTVAKVITCFQIGFLVLQCIGRAAQGLAITTLELSALAIVVCSVMTSLCWFRKPVNVTIPMRLYSQSTTAEMLESAATEGAKSWVQTPLDFIDDLGPSWALNVQPFMNMPVSPHERPLPRFGNDRLPNLSGRQEMVLCVATLGYAAIHLIGWNWSFPTRVESILWRLSSMLLFGLTVAFWTCETTAAWYRKGRWQRMFRKLTFQSKQQSDEFKGGEVSAGLAATQTKQLPLPWEFWSIFPLAILYAAARSYLVVEVFLGLRNLEASAYVDVNWSSFIPHV